MIIEKPETNAFSSCKQSMHISSPMRSHFCVEWKTHFCSEWLIIFLVSLSRANSGGVTPIKRYTLELPPPRQVRSAKCFPEWLGRESRTLCSVSLDLAESHWEAEQNTNSWTWALTDQMIRDLQSRNIPLRFSISQREAESIICLKRSRLKVHAWEKKFPSSAVAQKIRTLCLKHEENLKEGVFDPNRPSSHNLTNSKGVFILSLI